MASNGNGKRPSLGARIEEGVAKTTSVVFFGIFAGFGLWLIVIVVVFILMWILVFTQIIPSHSFEASPGPLPWITLLCCMVIAALYKVFKGSGRTKKVSIRRRRSAP